MPIVARPEAMQLQRLFGVDQQGPRPYMSAPLVDIVPTGVGNIGASTRRDRTQQQWQQVIEGDLTAWLRNSKQFEDDGVDPPSGTIVRLAMDIAESFRNQGWPGPDIVVADPNGGIVFERKSGDISEVVHIWDDGSAEYMQFDGTRMVQRAPL
jgi:hypothetical protein